MFNTCLIRPHGDETDWNATPLSPTGSRSRNQVLTCKWEDDTKKTKEEERVNVLQIMYNILYTDLMNHLILYNWQSNFTYTAFTVVVFYTVYSEEILGALYLTCCIVIIIIVMTINFLALFSK